jgi:hypothetical protein
MGKKSGSAQEWAFTGMIAMCVVEVVVMTSQENPIPSWMFPTVTEKDLVRIMHSLFPAFMNNGRDQEKLSKDSLHCRTNGGYLLPITIYIL